jgi:ATP-dependent DNA ligase
MGKDSAGEILAEGVKMKPMLCPSEAVPVEAALTRNWEGWVFEKKYDGVRGYVENGRLFSRRGDDITLNFPEFDLSQLPKDIIFDGEIVAANGSFDDISGRARLKDAFKIRLAQKMCPAKLMVFDVVIAGKPLFERRKLLESVQLPSWALLAEQVLPSQLAARWEQVIATGEEGLIAKRLSSLYQQGVRSPDALKIKAFRETVAEFVKYEDHPKGVTLETADGKRVNVNGSQARDAKLRIQRDGRVRCEVQYMPQEKSNEWRIPSFRGVCE